MIWGQWRRILWRLYDFSCDDPNYGYGYSWILKICIYIWWNYVSGNLAFKLACKAKKFHVLMYQNVERDFPVFLKLNWNSKQKITNISIHLIQYTSLKDLLQSRKTSALTQIQVYKRTQDIWNEDRESLK